METILEAIGHTPLVPLKRSFPPGCANVYAKLEKFNPGGSLKDRIVLRIITEAEKSGRLKPGGMVVAGTTGNSGIGLAYIGNVRKYKVILTMPENYSLERRRILEAYGAEVHLTPASEGMKGAINRAKEIAKEKNAFLFAQFEDPETPKAHELTTAREIEDALAAPIDALVATVGTSGTITGMGRVLKEKGARIIAVEPAASPLLSALLGRNFSPPWREVTPMGGIGVENRDSPPDLSRASGFAGARRIEERAGPHKIQGIGPGFVPPILDQNLIDEIVTVSDEEAFAGAKEIARNEGILAGISSGAAFIACKKVSRELGIDKNIVTVFPDGGERYFSLEKYFQR